MSEHKDGQDITAGMSFKVKWLASYPKSGNTWARMLLMGYNLGAVELNSRYPSAYSDANEFYYHNVCPTNLNNLSVHDQLLLRGAALVNLVAQSGVTTPLVKTHNANVAIDGQALLLPRYSGKVVYIVRDPRDVCVSLAAHSASPHEEVVRLLNSPTALIGDEGKIKSFLTSWSSHVGSYLQAKHHDVTVVRYEDMQKDVFRALIKILEGLGYEDIDHTRVGEAVELADFRRLTKKEETEGFLEAKNGKFFREGKTGGWRGVLSAENSALIKKEHGKVMGALGYV